MRANVCQDKLLTFPFLPDELVIELFFLRRYFPSAKRKRLEGK
jgi:hypothetical protein